jgi:uncharacterized membrane protein YraQ (UPF0718 family)
MSTRQRKANAMLVPTAVMGVLALALLAIGYARGQGEHLHGLRSGLTTMLQIVPLLLFAFVIAGMVQVLIPHQLLSRWIGAESGLRGILIGTVVGGFLPGGPYVSMPIAAGLLRAGASIGTGVALLTSWSLWAVARLPMEVGILGWRVALVRLASTFVFPPLAGWIAQSVFARFV